MYLNDIIYCLVLVKGNLFVRKHRALLNYSEQKCTIFLRYCIAFILCSIKRVGSLNPKYILWLQLLALKWLIRINGPLKDRGQ